MYIYIFYIYGSTSETFEPTYFSYVTLRYPDFIEFQHKLDPSPRDWRTTIHWNLFLAIFQQYHMYQDCWETGGTTCQCIVLIQSRDKVQKIGKLL